MRDVTGMSVKSAKGETLTAAAVDSVNTFDGAQHGRAQACLRKCKRRQAGHDG